METDVVSGEKKESGGATNTVVCSSAGSGGEIS